MKKQYVLIGACIVVMIAAFGYYDGFRVGTFGVGKLGTVEVTVPLIQSDVFFDTSEKMTTATNTEMVSDLLSPTLHQVIVSHVGYFPWIKKFVMPSGGRVTLNPFMIPENTSGEIITTKDPEYYALVAQVKKATLPTQASPVLSPDESTSVWVQNNVIYVQTGTNTEQVIAPEPLVKNVAFYKDRSDVIIFSAGPSVFAIETDSNPEYIQNIFPIFKGTDPLFIETDPSFIYVLDGTTLMQVVI